MNEEVLNKRDILEMLELFFGDPYNDVRLTMKETAKQLDISTKTLRERIEDNYDYVDYDKSTHTVAARSVIEKKYSLKRSK